MTAELRIAEPAPHLHAVPLQASGNDIEDIVADNLSRLRALRHLSLDGLARKSGVSRAMLAQIESGRSVPTIRVLQRVASALQVSVSAFLRNFAPQGLAVLPVQDSPRTVSGNGRFEFHELKLAALSTEHLQALVPGTQKNLVITHGTLEIQINDHRQLLGTGDAIFFDADHPHSYRNPADVDAVAYVVTQYPETRTV
jgi:transcriptional regulator with XRE-family HTH domain